MVTRTSLETLTTMEVVKNRTVDLRSGVLSRTTTTDLLLEVTKKVGVDVVNGVGRLREMRQVKENKDLVGGETSGDHVLC